NFLIVRFSTYNNWTYHLYFEAYEGQDISGKTTRTLNGKTYYLGEDYPSRSSNKEPQSQNAPQYTGFKAVMQNGGSRPYYDEAHTSGSNPELNYYYERQKYPIHYMDGIYVGGDDNTDILARNTLREIHTSADIPYDAPVPDADKNYKPNSSDASQPGYVFEGWYLDAACMTPYEFDTMPHHPITVYSKWVQEQYRVFMHPNAEDRSSNPGLNWGSDEQAMTFRVAYGGRVSTPEGVWTDGKKAFVAWLDENGNIFDGNVFVLNNETVTADYDKTDPGNYTDVMDKWGKGATYNNDENKDRWWITKKLDLYALWRDVMDGADGISVVYNATGLDASDPSKTITGKINNQDTYTDPLKYLDNTTANATAAAVADDTAYKFLYWVVQKWDPEADGGKGAYVDVTGENGEPVVAYPGAGFTVLASYAKVTTDAEDNKKKTYTLQLRAEYTPNNRAKCTIRWYQNDHEDSERLHEDKDLLINQATDIYTLEAGESIPTRKGYNFIGWARHNEYDVDPTTYKPVGDPITYHGGLTEDNLYFKYYTDGDTYGYLAKNDNNEWADVSRIAADESLMYQALYAVWEPLPSVAVLKVDVDDPAQYLDGAVFKLTKKNAAGQYVDYGENPYTTSEIYIGDTKQKGAFKIDEIENGYYRLTENTAPDGYIIETKNIDFKVVIINKKAEITITSGSDIARVDSSDKDKLIISNKSGTPLPLTGGLGTQIYTLGGILLIIAAASMYGFRMRRRGRRSN
ncbi:MAG: InlB B-repeat-containing protein, partial [Mogibacterium sp.]|nr:InlB B-repeat-containing protein [Mogibacterium sp.]